MCGRTGLSLDREQIRCACSFLDRHSKSFIKPEYLHEHNNGKEYTPSSNIAPTDVTPVLISSSKFKNAAHTSRVLKPMMWGIIPPWHKGHYKHHNLSTNNCRLENIQHSKLYSPILNNGGRCIIVAEGFYEWQTTLKNKVKQPYYIYMKQESDISISDPKSWKNEFKENEGWKGIKLLYMAGLYHAWQDNDVIIYSYSVITMDSNETFSWLHHRMPAILDNDEQVEAWLDIDNVNVNLALKYLTQTKILEWHPVSTLVNNSKNKSLECNRKISIEDKPKTMQKSLTAWFSKTTKRKSTEEISQDCKKPKI
ncbi:abasic site processing protein HMCES isoform X2 [Zerene cesonia]|uniref:abasic site processing protein HMCES isoform X2 n=1 Tax=Zerene cesonia TaxID=33412 RepID=UPI0018E4F721|nr:abasic site processing protein HMCES isoform X2 [Zerene cesonia]